MKQLIMIIFFAIVLLLYFGVSWFLYSRGVRALADTGFGKIFTWCFWILASSFIFGQILERGNPGFAAKLVTYVGSVWLALFLYLLLFVLVIDFVRVLNYYFHFIPQSLFSGVLSGKMLFVYVVLLSFVITIIGCFNAKNPIINDVNIIIEQKQSDKKELKVVLATDVHLGVLIGEKRVKRLVQQINNQEPDIVIFGGDLVDHNPVPVIKNDMGKFLKQIKAPYGVYAVTGNHEYIGKADISIQYLQKYGVKFIRDTILTINNTIQLAGREDREKIRFAGIARKELSQIMKYRNHNLPIILIDHQPVGYKDATEFGIDLMLSGHTHKGQLWPFNYITKLVFENDYGLSKKGNTFFYTSSGYGTWGPPVRIGNRPELVVFNISLK